MTMRLYRKDGRKIPSVTTITGQLDKPALTYWAANCAVDYILQELEEARQWERVDIDRLVPMVESARKAWRTISRQALDTGSAVHAAIERYLKNGREPQAPSDELLSAFLAFLVWLEKLGPYETLHTEQTLYDSQYRFAGTCDWIFTAGENTWVVDFKSSKGVYPEMRYQVAAYTSMYGGRGRKLLRPGILRLDKETGMPEFVDCSGTYAEDLEVFLTLANLWHARNKGVCA